MIDLFPLRKLTIGIYLIHGLNCTSVKHLPSWFPGGGFQKRLATTRGYVTNMKNVPFERVQAERVNIFRTRLFPYLVIDQ